jgi:hypothetical protein
MKAIPDWLYYQMSYNVSPIDVSLWEMRSRKCPSWWPTRRYSVEYDKIDRISPMSVRLIKEFVEEKCCSERLSTNLLFASGPVKPKEGWDVGTLSTDFTVMGFGYQSVGKSMPSDEAIFQSLLSKPRWLSSPYAENPMTYFDNPHKGYYTPAGGSYKIDDIVVVPLIARLDLQASNTWQWFRFWPHGNLFGLSGFLYVPEIKYKRCKKKYKYVLSPVRKTVANAYTWTMGLIERIDRDMPIPSGHVIETDRRWLMNRLADQKLRLAFASRLRFFVRRYSYEKPQVYSVFRSFGLSSLII